MFGLTVAVKREKGREGEVVIPFKFRLARKELPNEDELVIGTVKNIVDHGAYVMLDEYGGKEAYVSIGEIVHSWFHDVKDYIKEGHKAVFKVLRVDYRRGLIDLSLKRVKPEEREKKMYYWKRLLRAVRILDQAARRMGRRTEDLMEVLWKMEDYFGDPLRGLEALAREGRQAVAKLSLDEDTVAVLEDVAKQNIQIPTIKKVGIARLVSVAPDGVRRIGQVFSRAVEAVKKEQPNVDVRIYTIGSPRYRVEFMSKEGKALETAIQVFTRVAQEEARRNMGEFSIQFAEEKKEE